MHFLYFIVNSTLWLQKIIRVLSNSNYSMIKTGVIVFISLFCALNSASVRRKKRDAIVTTTAPLAAPKWTYQPSNYSDHLIDVTLRDPSRLNTENNVYITTNTSHGVIEAFLPGAPESVFLCFPLNTEDYRRAYILSHIICRQLGFMTFISMNSRPSASTDGKPYYGLKPNSFSCTGQEQNISHCGWDNVSMGSCKAITELSCGNCQYALKDLSGSIEVPGYPLVNIHDVTCEWDLILQEDHSISLTFHHFQSLFVKSLKPFCNLYEPYMDIIYGQSNKINYQRYCNFDDLINVTIPDGGVKIRIFTGVYSPHRIQNDAIGRGVAITYNAILTRQTSNWSWQIAFVLLMLIIFVITSAIFHYCKKYGICIAQRDSNSLPTVNVPPSMASIDRAYEFQRCAVQRQQKEKIGLRLRSNGSGEKAKCMFPQSFCPDTTLVISSAEKKENFQHHIYSETPRIAIPEIVLNGISDEEISALERLKVNLMDRYSRNSCDVSGISSRVSASSPVFFPPTQQTFQIYSSVSSDTEKQEEKKPPPPAYDSAL